jgi:hypothetical protein
VVVIKVWLWERGCQQPVCGILAIKPCVEALQESRNSMALTASRDGGFEQRTVERGSDLFMAKAVQEVFATQDRREQVGFVARASGIEATHTCRWRWSATLRSLTAQAPFSHCSNGAFVMEPAPHNHISAQSREVRGTSPSHSCKSGGWPGNTFSGSGALENAES